MLTNTIYTANRNLPTAAIVSLLKTKNMKILIFTNDLQTGYWAKDTLEEFGRGMQISVVSDNSSDILEKNWSHIITFIESDTKIPAGKRHTNLLPPTDDEERAQCRRELWVLYRDTLRDMIGNKCSCGLYDTCHCH